jgi:chromosomal replication initiation ATPase DnaA
MLEAKAGLKTKRGILTSLIGVFAEFKASIKAAGEKKTEYRKKLERKISLLKAYCNILINEISLKLKPQNKKLLIIIEDIDKAETTLTHEIFFKHSGILSELNTQIIFTVSIFTLTTPELAGIRGSFEDLRLPMIKIKNKEDASPCEPGIAAIRNIVEKRADLSLFEAREKVLELMIARSGGVLRDLFEMIEIAANCASLNKSTQIDRSAADYAFERLKSKYRGMITAENIVAKDITTKGLYQRLAEVKDSKTKQFPLDKEILVLLSCLAVVEYNGTQWFDVHPAVASILESIDLGKVNGE